MFFVLFIKSFDELSKSVGMTEGNSDGNQTVECHSAPDKLRAICTALTITFAGATL